jgi:hypothetical protein
MVSMKTKARVVYVVVMLSGLLFVALGQVSGGFYALDLVPVGESAVFVVSGYSGAVYSWEGPGTVSTNDYSSTFTSDPSLPVGGYSATCHVTKLGKAVPGSPMVFSWTVFMPSNSPSPSTVLPSSTSAGGLPTFFYSNLPSGVAWSVSVSGVALTFSSTTPIITADLPAGNYLYAVNSVNGYVIVSGGSGYVFAGSSVSVSFSPSQQPTASPTASPLSYYSVTCNVSPASSGVVSVNPASSQFLAGSTVTLSATAMPGYRFDHWLEVLPYPGAIYSNPLSFAIDQNYIFTAVFAPEPTSAPSVTSATSPSPSLGSSNKISPSPSITPTLSPPSVTLPATTTSPIASSPSSVEGEFFKVNALSILGLVVFGFGSVAFGTTFVGFGNKKVH